MDSKTSVSAALLDSAGPGLIRLTSSGIKQNDFYAAAIGTAWNDSSVPLA